MLSTTAEYALRAIVALAQQGGGQLTTSSIAEVTKVPPGYLAKVMQQLVRADLVTSQRGIGGGFTLTRPAREISILDILRAVDAAPARIRRCPLGIKGHVRLCPLHKLVDDAMQTTEQAFAKANLQDLSESADGIQGLCEAQVLPAAPEKI